MKKITNNPTSVPKKKKPPAAKKSVEHKVIIEKEKYEPFDPSKDSDKGCHRNAYIKNTMDVEGMIFNGEDGTPVKMLDKIRLNERDTVRISTEDFDQRIIRSFFTEDGKENPYPIRFAFRRGWMWIKGSLLSNQILVE